MMNPKVITWLQKIFWIVGWAVLVLTVGTIAFQTYDYFQPSTGLIQWPKKEFDFLHQTRILFSAVGQAFFAFLVSSIFGMIFQRAPARTEQTEIFLKLTCIGFAGDGILGLISWIRSAFYIFPQTMKSGWEILSGLSYLLSVFSILISFVYAITIYVLYRHFSQLVTFESEVV